MLFDRLWTRSKNRWTLPRVPVDIHRLYFLSFYNTIALRYGTIRALAFSNPTNFVGSQLLSPLYASSKSTARSP